MRKSRTYIVTPPGATIKEQVLDRGISQTEFAARMALTEKLVSKLIHSEVQLTTDVALRLEMVLGVPAHFWNNLESLYRKKLALVQAENELEEEIKIANKFPFSSMVKIELIEKANRLDDKVFQLVSLVILKGSFIPSIACRQLSTSLLANYVLIAWVQK